jgi:N-carbamoyl-L-amino-acid hydrolase
MEAEVEVALADCARRSRCTVEIAEKWGFGGFSFDPELIGLLRGAAATLGHPTMDLRSEAGHDAYHMVAVCPSAMIFAPCVDGITHNEAEDMSKEDMIPAANVLLHAALARADR